MPEAARAHWSRWLLVSLGVIAADLATKAWITSVLAPGEGRDVTSFLRIVLVFNRGAAFSFLADAGGWQRWFFMLVSAAISVGIVVMLGRPHAGRLVPLALALVLGGALGNLWDRLTLGHVVDFVLVHVGRYAWPAFNVADSAITVGVALLVLDSLRSRGERAAPSPEKP